MKFVIRKGRSAAVGTAALVALTGCVAGPSTVAAPGPAGPAPTAAPSTTTTVPALPVPVLQVVPDGIDDHIWDDGASNLTQFSGSDASVAATLPGGFDPGAGDAPVFFSITETGFGTNWHRGVRDNGNVVVPLMAVGERTQSVRAVTVEGCPAMASLPTQCTRMSATSTVLTANWITKPSIQVIVDGIPGRTEVIKAPNATFDVSVGSTNVSSFPAGAVAFLRIVPSSVGPGYHERLSAADAAWQYSDSMGEATVRGVVGLGCPVAPAGPDDCALVTDESTGVRLVFDNG